MCASSQRSPDAVAVLSYMIESATYYNEASVHASVDAGRARFVYLVSIFFTPPSKFAFYTWDVWARRGWRASGVNWVNVVVGYKRSCQKTHGDVHKTPA